MRFFILIGAALLGTPALAQQSAPPAAEPEAAASIDPARFALAIKVVDRLWPLGTYERMMKSSMEEMTATIVDSMFDMPLSDMTTSYGSAVEQADPKLARTTMRELISKNDPHFQERMRISNKVMMIAMIPLMNRLEPEVRDALARAHARKFSAVQLEEIERFFATETGRTYGTELMMLWVDPEMTAVMSRFGPEMVKEMPQIMKQVREATAHLPAPKLPERRRRRGD